MPFCGNFDWDKDLGKPVIYQPMYHRDWEDNLTNALNHWWRNWGKIEDYNLDELPYWGA